MRLLERSSIRVRITVGTLTLAFVLFLVAAAIVYGLVGRLLVDSSSTLSRADAAAYETAIVSEPGEPLDRPTPGQLVAVIAPDGSEAVSTLPPGLRSAVGDPEASRDDVRELTVDGTRYVVVVERVEAGDGTWTVVAARDERASDLVMSRLVVGLVTACAVLVLAFGAASWLLTGSALRPVDRLRRSAESLADGRSGDLLPVGPAVDEVNELAVTLNGLIGGLRAAALRERQMVSDASHELRTPLAVLQGRLELLRIDPDDPDAAADLASARSAAERLRGLVTDLLELSRLESGAADVAGPRGHATIGELAGELGEAVDRARAAATSRSAEIGFELVGDAIEDEHRVSISPRTFGRVIDNLVSNALAAGATHVRLVLSVTAGTVELAVVDDGPGMPEAFIGRAFDRFSRSDAARSATGAGLGLAIVSAAARSAGGRASLENRTGRGLVVRVVLPLRAPSQDA